MFSKITKVRLGTAAWRISFWSSVAFAIGTAVAFWFLQSFLANDIQSRADGWLTGEIGVLADVAQRTPANRLHDAVVDEVAELASREAPHDDSAEGVSNLEVFFLETTADGRLYLHTGMELGTSGAAAVRESAVSPGKPANVTITGVHVPFRVAEARLSNGDQIYLGLSTRYERKTLHRLRREFAMLWVAMIALGTAIVFFSTRRMLYRVHVITDIANSVGRRNLSSRVPALGRNDEISRLSLTLNRMLDRIEVAVQQLHAMSDALAHDLRSPITSVRGKLELALMADNPHEREEAIVRSIEELDRVTSLLTTSLDVSEASADALRLRKQELDLEATMKSLIELYEPSFSQAGLQLGFQSSGPVLIKGDVSLLQRTLANLLDNEYKHLSPGCSVSVRLHQNGDSACLVVEDDGRGFSSDLLPRVFERYAKGTESQGHGLGLAFVAAVIRSHEGSVTAANGPLGGASITVDLPLERVEAMLTASA